MLLLLKVACQAWQPSCLCNVLLEETQLLLQALPQCWLYVRIKVSHIQRDQCGPWCLGSCSHCSRVGAQPILLPCKAAATLQQLPSGTMPHSRECHCCSLGSLDGNYRYYLFLGAMFQWPRAWCTRCRLVEAGPQAGPQPGCYVRDTTEASTVAHTRSETRYPIQQMPSGVLYRHCTGSNCLGFNDS